MFKNYNNHYWVNKTADGRVDCRRQAGLYSQVALSEVGSLPYGGPSKVKDKVIRCGPAKENEGPGYTIPVDKN